MKIGKSLVKKEKIIHVITTIENGGAERQLAILVSEQIKMGNSVTIAYLKGRGDLLPKFNELEIDVFKLNNILGPLSQIFHLYVLCKLFRYTITHCHLPRAEIIGNLASLTCKSRLIISRHNAEPFFSKVPSLLSSGLSRIFTHRASKVICISEAVRQFLIRNREVKSNENLTVIHYGYDQTFVQGIPPKTGFRDPSQPFNIGTVARLVKQKNIFLLLDAFSLISLHHPDSFLTIVGTGPEKLDLLVHAQQLCIENRIRWIDRSNNIAAIMSNFDVFILTSNYEGFGMVLLEALQLNLPVVARNISAIPEVLGYEYPGLFKNSTKEDVVLAFERVTRVDFLQNLNRKILSKFDSAKMANRIQEVY